MKTFNSLAVGKQYDVLIIIYGCFYLSVQLNLMSQQCVIMDVTTSYYELR